MGLSPEALRTAPRRRESRRWSVCANSTARQPGTVIEAPGGHGGVRARSLAVALLLLWSGASGAADPAELARGKEVFSTIQPACAACHTLQAAGAEGQVGPVLDELKPDAARVLRALKAGIGVMPSYAERMSESDMKAVASFVAHAAGAAK